MVVAVVARTCTMTGFVADLAWRMRAVGVGVPPVVAALISTAAVATTTVVAGDVVVAAVAALAP